MYCYDTLSSNLENYLNINGYYEFTEKFETTYGVPTTHKQVEQRVNMLFQSDGSFVHMYNYTNGSGYRGSYIITHDTIKALYINPPCMMSHNDCEVWFKIVDENTLKILYEKCSEFISQKDLESIKFLEKKSFVPNNTYISVNSNNGNVFISDIFVSLGKLISFDSIPLHPNIEKNNWLKKRKNMWCDKKEYYHWKKEMRKKKSEK